jgi:CRP-like cAMP-binding protein
MLTSLFMKLRSKGRIDAEERQILEASISQTRNFSARQTIVREGAPLTTSNLLLDGVMCRYKDLPDGRRQILGLHIAGDFVDLHSFLLKRLDHSIAALTSCQIAVVPHEAITIITEKQPHLGRALWLSTLIDAAMHREWTLTMGRRSASSRVAHLFCEMFIRHQAIDQVENNSYPLPLTQVDVGDACGLTPVHVNRMLQQIRHDGSVEFRDGRVTVHDWERLVATAEFDPAYLYLDAR